MPSMMSRSWALLSKQTPGRRPLPPSVMSRVFLALGDSFRRVTTSRIASSMTEVKVRPLSRASRLASVSNWSSRRIVVLIGAIIGYQHQYVKYTSQVWIHRCRISTCWMCGGTLGRIGRAEQIGRLFRIHRILPFRRSMAWSGMTAVFGRFLDFGGERKTGMTEEHVPQVVGTGFETLKK